MLVCFALADLSGSGFVSHHKAHDRTTQAELLRDLFSLPFLRSHLYVLYEVDEWIQDLYS